jgi:hypothetical protein
MIRDLAHAAADILDAVAEATWRDWLANSARAAAVLAIVISIMALAVGFAPYTPGQ